MTSKYDRYSKEELVKIIEDRDRKPTFGLVWERDDIEFDRSFNQDFVALDAIGELSCGTGPWSNLLIEGDNFDALRYLRMTHAGRVKCICIALPYNTGNMDFMVKVKGRSKGDGILLIEVKGEFLINSLNTPDKALASHKLYRKPLMVMHEDSGRWMTLRYNEKTDKLEPDAVFRVDALAEY